MYYCLRNAPLRLSFTYGGELLADLFEAVKGRLEQISGELHLFSEQRNALVELHDLFTVLRRAATHTDQGESLMGGGGGGTTFI